MNKKLYFGSNLKMYKNVRDTVEYLAKLTQNTSDISRDDIQLFIIPSFTALEQAAACTDQNQILLGAQNMCWEDQGQFTGEISPLMLKELGLGYLTLGEETPSLSGGEAQRLKLASEMGKLQNDSLFIFDEPTIGLHPLDVQTLLKVFQTLIENGATVVVIEHDLDVIRNADYIIDMGPGGGADGGRIVACETPEQLAKDPNSQTGRYL